MPRSPDAAAGPLWILWLDGLGALTAGIVMLALRHPLAMLYGLPPTVLAAMGAVNLLFSTLGLVLVRIRHRPRWLLRTLVAANYAWAVVGALLAIAFFTTATIFGLGHIVIEAAYVATLATLEWRRRDALAPSRPSPG